MSSWIHYQRNRAIAELPEVDYLGEQFMVDAFLIPPGSGGPREVRIGVEWLDENGVRVYDGGTLTLSPLSVNLSATPPMVMRNGEDQVIGAYNVSAVLKYSSADTVAFRVVSASPANASITHYNLWVSVG